MIEKLIIKDPNVTPVKWWAEVEAYKGIEEFSFKPGLNILWGPNGSGKSSLLRVMARLGLSENSGGVPTLSQETLEAYRKPYKYGEPNLPCPASGVEIVGHEGYIYFYESGTEVGLSHGGAAFDYDFTSDAIISMRDRRLSAGQNGMSHLNRFLLRVKSHYREGVKNKKKWLETINDVWSSAAERAFKVIGEPNKPAVVLLDEPFRSMDPLNQKQGWDLLCNGVSKHFQVIVATHSWLGLRLPDANYISVGDPDYLKQCEAVAAEFSKRFA